VITKDEWMTYVAQGVKASWDEDSLNAILSAAWMVAHETGRQAGRAEGWDMLMEQG
jgi:hypothetical protein